MNSGGESENEKTENEQLSRLISEYRSFTLEKILSDKQIGDRYKIAFIANFANSLFGFISNLIHDETFEKHREYNLNILSTAVWKAVSRVEEIKETIANE